MYKIKKYVILLNLQIVQNAKFSKYELRVSFKLVYGLDGVGVGFFIHFVFLLYYIKNEQMRRYN